MEFREVVGYEGLYEISDSVIVRGVDRFVDLPNGKTRFIPSRILTQRVNNCGYLYVRLSKNGQTKLWYVHRLIAEAFISNPDNLPQVNHLKTKQDNTPADLEWSSVSSNTLHSYNTGLNKHQGGDHTFAVGIIDNSLGQTFATIKEWCQARQLNYNTGRNILSGWNESRLIDKTLIIRFKPLDHGEINGAS